eukprot:scaffold67534_cov69-Phaeocystis_antarctica.AAC.4
MPPPLGEAVLFELRALPSLPNCLLNYVTLLPSGWVVHFWHSSSNAAMIHASSALQPALASGRLVLTYVENKADMAGQRGPSGRLAEAGRSAGQPGARFGAERGLRRASWLRFEPPCFPHRCSRR